MSGGQIMLHQNEMVMFLLGICVLIFTLANHRELKRLQAWKTFIAAFYTIFASWIMTILEGFLWENLLNYLEHIGYAISSSLLALWCWQVFGSRKETR